MLYVPVEVV